MKKRWKDPEPQRARGEKIKELWADPEWAARQREKLKAGSATLC